MSFPLLLKSHLETKFPFFQDFPIAIFLTIFVQKTVLINLIVDLAEDTILLKNFLENIFLCVCVHDFSTLNSLPGFLDMLNQYVLSTPYNRVLL